MNSTNARSFAACPASEMIVGGIAGRKVPVDRAAMLCADKLPGVRHSRKLLSLTGCFPQFVR
jgi:hypothetical protein